MRKPFLAIALAAILAGCASTPPPPPTLDLPAATAGDLKLDRWWTAFGDPTLDKLVDEALANNLDLAAAIARVEYGRAAVLLAQSDLYPTVDLAVGASRIAHDAGRLQSAAVRIFAARRPTSAVGLQASYEVDLWGKYRTATAAAQQDLLATEFARETVRTMVEADTARYYFNLLAADVELRLLLDTLKLRDESVALQKDRYQAGVIGEYDLRTAEAERASVAGDIAVARARIDRIRVGARSAARTLAEGSVRAVDRARRRDRQADRGPDAALRRPVGPARRAGPTSSGPKRSSLPRICVSTWRATITTRRFR